MKFLINADRCTVCGGCSSVCESMAIDVFADKVEITDSCIGCGTCEKFCPVSAIACDRPGVRE